MHKELIIKAFKKAKKERQKKGEKKPSLVHIAEDLASFVDQTEGLGLTEKSYRIYHGEARKHVDTSEDISIKQLKVINGLSKYLGYSNYEDFASSLGDKSLKKTLITFFKKNKIVLIVFSLFLISYLIFFSATRQRWMVWANDQYIEVSFDVDKYNIDELKLYNEERITHFKKIKPTCETEFFTVNNKVKLWYGKNIKKELQFFTALGLHPETGRTLDPITEYMIRKYICPSSEKRD